MQRINNISVFKPEITYDKELIAFDGDYTTGSVRNKIYFFLKVTIHRDFLRTFRLRLLLPTGRFRSYETGRRKKYSREVYILC